MKRTAAAAPVTGMQNTSAVRKLTVLALLSAVGYVSMLFIKVPVIGFLSYEPKDIFLTLAGFLYGPLAALACCIVTGMLELFVSSTGLIGMIMNIVASAAFACTASFIYKKRRDILGAALGLISAVAAMTVCMLLWNYLISPLYMGVSRAEIVPLLSTMFLPFNLLKAGINAALTMLLYRPFLHVLRLCGFPVSDHLSDKKGSVVLTAAVSAVLLALCIGVVAFLKRG
ncbi:MAG: ECF transporter S component [Oscillospiraceae bacterium]|nr:ECF transporter S component [Oscillospiraceae bacterium]